MKRKLRFDRIALVTAIIAMAATSVAILIHVNKPTMDVQTYMWTREVRVYAQTQDQHKTDNLATVPYDTEYKTIRPEGPNGPTYWTWTTDEWKLESVYVLSGLSDTYGSAENSESWPKDFELQPNSQIVYVERFEAACINKDGDLIIVELDKDDWMRQNKSIYEVDVKN